MGFGILRVWGYERRLLAGKGGVGTIWLPSSTYQLSWMSATGIGDTEDEDEEDERSADLTLACDGVWLALIRGQAGSRR